MIKSINVEEGEVEFSNAVNCSVLWRRLGPTAEQSGAPSSTQIQRGDVELELEQADFEEEEEEEGEKGLQLKRVDQARS
jgi:hypothetical protein